MGVDLESLAALLTQSPDVAIGRSTGAARQFFLAQAAFESTSAAAGGAAAGWVVRDFDRGSDALVLEVDVPSRWRGSVRPTVRRIADFTIQDGLLASFTVDGHSLRDYVCPLVGNGATGWLLARTLVDVPVALVTSVGLVLDGSKPARGRRLEISAWCEGERRVFEMLGAGWALGRGWCAQLLLPRGEAMPIAEFRSVRLEGTPGGAVLMNPKWDHDGTAADQAGTPRRSKTAGDLAIAPEVSAAARRRVPDAAIDEVLQVELAATELIQAGRTADGVELDVRSAVDLAADLLRLGDAPGSEPQTPR